MITQISIIIPVFNREKIVARTLDSIICQSFKDWECIIVDDFSTDSTWNVLLKYADLDPRIHAYRNERQKGACGARNTGLDKAKGGFIQFFDSDDKMYPTLLYDLYGQFTDEVDVVTCWTNVINRKTNKIVKTFENYSEGDIHNSLLKAQTYVDTNCALIRRHVIDKIDGWSEDCPSFQEWDFHLRLSKEAKYKTYKKHLIDYYIDGDDTISKSKERAALGQMYILNKFKQEFLRVAPYIYITHNLLIWSWIKEITEKKSQEHLLNIFKKDKNTLFLLFLKVLYYVRLMKIKFK